MPEKASHATVADYRWDTGPMSIVQSRHSPALGQPGKYRLYGPRGVNLTPSILYSLLYPHYICIWYLNVLR